VQRQAYFRVEPAGGLAGEMRGQKIELAPPPQATEHDRFRERRIARLQRGRVAAQQIGGVAASINFYENAKTDFPCNGCASHKLRLA
jgi:hypothetical protein